MIITLKGANFSANKIGTLDTWSINAKVGTGATYNGASSVARGGVYSGTVTLDDSYEATSVTVTMGGTDISTAASVSGNTITISIASVTGTVYINVVTKNTATGEEDSGTSETYTLSFRDAENRIVGYMANNGAPATGASSHSYFSIPATGIRSISMTQTNYVDNQSLYYIIHVDGSGVTKAYAPINTPNGETMTVNLGNNATGVIYFNAFDINKTTSAYPLEATITTV